MLQHVDKLLVGYFITRLQPYDITRRNFKVFTTPEVYITAFCVMTFSQVPVGINVVGSHKAKLHWYFAEQTPSYSTWGYLAVHFHVLCKEHDISVCARGHELDPFPKRCVLFKIHNVKCNIQSSIILDLKET